MKNQLAKITETSERIGIAYHALTFHNLKYHWIVRELEKTNKSMKETSKTLNEMLWGKVKEKKRDRLPEVESVLEQANVYLTSSMKELETVIKKMKAFTTTVNRLMDANDELENCLNMLESIELSPKS